MSEEEIEVLLQIRGKFYEGRLRPQQIGQHTQISEQKKAMPIFPEPYGEMLTIIDEGNYWLIKPKQFLQTADFAEIARIIKEQYHGTYVSAGRSSHFRLPK